MVRTDLALHRVTLVSLHYNPYAIPCVLRSDRQKPRALHGEHGKETAQINVAVQCRGLGPLLGKSRRSCGVSGCGRKGVLTIRAERRWGGAGTNGILEIGFGGSAVEDRGDDDRRCDDI